MIAKAGRVRVAAIVFIETLWVLQRSYRRSRTEIIRVATALLDHPRYQVDQAELLRAALQVYSGANVDFADALALTDARRANIQLYTFDRKLAGVTGVVGVPALI